MARQKKDVQLVIVTGLSGAGKTQAIRSLEDLGYFCVDNLPPNLIPKFADLFVQPESTINKIALVIDIRGGTFFDSLFEALKYLDANGFPYEILFLEAADETLIRRFKETRRRHPLSTEGRILEGIVQERLRLQELRGRASKIIDTSELSNQELRRQVEELFGYGNKSQLVITIITFGYKFGIPLDADLVMDVRFLPNPHYIEELRELTGENVEVQDYVMRAQVTQDFISRFNEMLSFLIPSYIQEGKTYLVVAIGCTGGQHRSVALGRKIGEYLHDKGFKVSVKHRDVNKSKLGGEK
ncbi:MAG: RNase adapter RapZ [Bacillota bacterium]